MHGDSLPFTIICTSTGGPVTTVTWTRDESTDITEGTKTVLANRKTAQYIHTLTGNVGGEYTCTVANNIPTSVSITTRIRGIYI